VALKVIKPGYLAPAMLRRFELESQVLGRLQHPGIAQIYEAGVFKGGHADDESSSRRANPAPHSATPSPGHSATSPAPIPFFAMEFVRAIPLTDQAAPLIEKCVEGHTHRFGPAHHETRDALKQAVSSTNPGTRPNPARATTSRPRRGRPNSTRSRRPPRNQSPRTNDATEVTTRGADYSVDPAHRNAAAAPRPFSRAPSPG